MFGISTGAVRNRLSRGTLASVKENGVVYVLLPADMSRDAERDADDTPPEMSRPDSSALISEMRDRLRYVEGQLEAERQAHAQARRIIAGLVERIPAIEAPHAPSALAPRTLVKTPTFLYHGGFGRGRFAFCGGEHRPVALSRQRRTDGRWANTIRRWSLTPSKSPFCEKHREKDRRRRGGPTTTSSQAQRSGRFLPVRERKVRR